jgi:hypothetical protein
MGFLEKFKQGVYYYLDAGGHIEYNELDLYRLRLLNSIILLSVLAGIFMGWVDYNRGSYALFFSDIIVPCIFLFLWGILRFRKALEPVGYVILCIIFFGILNFIISIEDMSASYRLLVGLTFPILAVFLKGRRVGVWLSIAYGTVLVATYSYLMQTRDLKVDALVYFTVIYIFQNAALFLSQVLLEKNAETIFNKTVQLNKKNRDLNNSLSELATEVAQRARIEEYLSVQRENLKAKELDLSKKEQELREQNEELARLNKFMIDRELKMDALKHKVEELEKHQ